MFHGVGWNGGPVLFDLGDVLDDYRVDRQLRNDLGVLAIWRPHAEQQLELVGLRLEYCHTRLADGADADWIAARLERACSRPGDHGHPRGRAALHDHANPRTGAVQIDGRSRHGSAGACSTG